MFYHHVLAWKACYTCFTAVLCKPTSRTNRKVSISSPSSEGGESKRYIMTFLERGGGFPLVLLQAKVVGLHYRLFITLHYISSGVSISSPSSEGGSSVFKRRHSKAFKTPNRRTPFIKKKNQHGNFCQNDDLQTLTQYGIDAGQRENQGFSDSGRCVCEVFLNTKNHLPATLNRINND